MTTSRRMVRFGVVMTLAIAALVPGARPAPAAGVDGITGGLPGTPAAVPKPDGAPHLVGLESLSPADQARQRAQAPLLNLNNRVYDVTADVYDEHYAGTQPDYQKKSLVVYWAGQAPAQLLGLQADAEKSGITLTIKPARFSRQYLMAVAKQIMPTGELPGTIEISNDGSGLTVALSDLPAVANGLRAATGAEDRLLGRIASARSRLGVPVAVVAKRPESPQFDASIWDDSSPYWAGAVMGNCSSGFSMFASGAPATRFTLTAAHCSNYTDDVEMRDGGGGPADIMGRTDFIHELYDVAPTYDLGVVRLNPGLTNAPYIYVGVTPSQGAIAVKGYASGGLGQGQYCVHGVRSVNCNVWSTGTTLFRCDFPPGNRCLFYVPVRSFDMNQNMWCRGDSGGPIYYWNGDSVVASGVVSWSNHEFEPCSRTGGAAVVASAVNRISGLTVLLA